jgi:UDP:flavonoid glycosyltransferase YjiC (YdhE family)
MAKLLAMTGESTILYSTVGYTRAMAHVAVYVSGHGFGHATRMAAVIGALVERVPDLEITLVSTAPEWLFRRNIAAPFSYRARALDVGVVQKDSIRLDVEATLVAYARLLERQAALVEQEADVLRHACVKLVVADIPPAAFSVARRVGVPGVGISNFSWDWIYAEYVREFPSHASVVEAIRAAYGEADLFLRLPFHGPCDVFPVVRDIPLVARGARHSRADARRRLGLSDTRPVILLSFGGFEIRGIDFAHVESLEDFQFLVTQPLPRPVRNVRAVAMDGLYYEDIVAQADAVITKPGYGIVSECLVNRIPVLYTPRGHFAEYDCLVQGLERFGVCRRIGNDDLLAGNWGDALKALLAQPCSWPDLPANGAQVAASILQDLLPGA